MYATLSVAKTKFEKLSGLNWIPRQPITIVILPSALPTELLTEVSCLAQKQKSV